MLDRYNYEIGDKEIITGCGPDYSGMAEATVIYVDKKYAIAHIPCGSRIYALGLNINPNEYVEMSHEEVAGLLDISKYGEYDVFLNFYGNKS